MQLRLIQICQSANSLVSLLIEQLICGYVIDNNFVRNVICSLSTTLTASFKIWKIIISADAEHNAQRRNGVVRDFKLNLREPTVYVHYYFNM